MTQDAKQAEPTEARRPSPPPPLPVILKHMRETQETLCNLAELERPATEPGLAQAIADAFATRIRYVFDAKSWYIFDGASWRPDAADAVTQAALIALKAQAAKAESNHNLFRKKELAKLEKASAIRAAISLAESDPRLACSLTSFDADPYAIHTPGGLRIDLRDLSSRPTEAADMNTMVMGCDPDFDAEAPRFAKFMLEISADDPELAGWIISRCGYCLTASTMLQDFEVWKGGGRNGKSTLQKLRAHIFGTYGVTVAADFFLEPRNGGGGPSPELLSVRGRRLVEASETAEGQRLNIGRIKSLTSGDRQAARALFSNQIIIFDPVAKLCLATNAEPQLGRVDHAIRRRTKIVPFQVKFDGARENPRLLNELLEEAPAIAGEFIRAASAFTNSGVLPPCRAIDEASRDYLDDEDILTRWIGERCIIDPQATTPASALYADFRTWLEAQGVHSWSMQAFGRALTDHGYPIRKASIVYREGLRLA